jgi:hypothetical protein
MQLRFDLSVKLIVDYQFIDTPAFNTDKGPVNLFAGRSAERFKA